MENFVYIVIFAVVTLFLLFLYDKRSSILTFFKEKVFKPKPIKIPKIKTKNKVDPDTIPDTDKMGYGKVKYPDELQQQNAEVFQVDNIFAPKDDFDNDDIDLDKMFEELQSQSISENSKRRDPNDLTNMPDFDSMSLNDLDNLLENSLGRNNMDDFGSYLPNSGSDISGEEIGKMLKNLPPQIKVLIASDILKRKDFDDKN